jgi:hypothetical protein
LGSGIVRALDDERAHGEADGNPEQGGEGVAGERDGQDAAGVGDAAVHHELGDDVGLARAAER